MHSRATKVLTIVVIAAVLCYLGAIVYLRVEEPSLVFVRIGNLSALEKPADSLRLPYREVTIQTADSVGLGAWVIPSSHADSTGIWVLICHGQTGNLAT